MSIKSWFLTSFREIFLYHYRSLEFRAKVFALIIAPSCESAKVCDFTTLKKVAEEIYADRHRREVFLNIIKEYIAVILRNPATAYDEAVRDINRKVKIDKNLAKKIDMSHINRFVKADLSEDRRLLQQRITEFLEVQSKIS